MAAANLLLFGLELTPSVPAPAVSAATSWIFLGFGAALVLFKLRPESIRNKTPYVVAWFLFFAVLFAMALFGIIKVANNGYPSNMALCDLWNEIVSWTLLGAGAIALYQALTPATGKPDRGDRTEKPAESDRSRRRGGRAESQRREAVGADAEPGTDAEDTRARARTPSHGSRPSNRFGWNIDADKPDAALEAKVDDALDAEPELVLSKDDDLPLEPPAKPAPLPELSEPLPPLDPEPLKVKTTSASISRSRNQAVERPKTEIVPAVKRTGPGGSGSRTGIPATAGAGSRTGIPVTGSGEPVSVPVAPPASRSGKRPAASGVRPAAKSGAAPALTESESVDTPSKDQYLDK